MSKELLSSRLYRRAANKAAKAAESAPAQYNYSGILRPHRQREPCKPGILRVQMGGGHWPGQAGLEPRVPKILRVFICAPALA
ncbi:MAG: hypothetical protein DU429_06510 [Candidatus Tokpelaia sp.]|nr:MAG: hypothetical protein DU430_04495 [Candidatus Tokpelaia sp.]KAA6206214.1 MAG: hypothetical protein DU429_06510 [Candidatus Tokpelaia sp.]